MKIQYKIMLGTGLVVVAAAGVLLDTLYDGGAFREIVPHFDGRCEKVMGATGVEDITVDRDTGLAYLSSHDRRRWMRTGEAEGHIYRYRAGSMAQPLEFPNDYSGSFHPHGIGLWKNPAGHDRLFVVNHPNSDEAGSRMDSSRSQVEVFDVLEDGLRHVRTVKPDGDYSLNDVTPDGPDTFYASVDRGSSTSFGRTLETFGRLARGGIARGDASGIWRVEGDLTYPNGISVSPDGRYLMVAETTGNRVLAYRRRGEDGSLERIAEANLGTASDNIEWAEDGSFWIGAHPVALAFPAHARDAANRSPSQVIRVRFDGTGFESEEIYLNDGDPLSGSSVAAPIGNRFLLGAVFEPFFLDCEKAAP
ncbi:SMP-30/gluconolactonase/LRE family protein [Kordiimonas sp.]|uniref:SMP-30/gluconolactonase/LRE family protein n=1 Tax=Kordiimonas sp. TaxID=1970157 RepID=UPI003A91D35B